MIGVLIIGDEILSGHIRETNLDVMIQKLRSAGIEIGEVRMVRDQVQAIRDAVNALRQTYDFVVSSGGIGPTHDDVTLAAMAEAFGVELVEHEGLAQKLRDYYGSRITPGHLIMTHVPSNAELIETDTVHWPLIKIGNCFALPGLPELFVMKFDQVLAWLPKGKTQYFGWLHVSEREPAFAIELEAIQARHRRVQLGSYPRYHRKPFAVKITVQSQDASEIESCMDELLTFFGARESLVKHQRPRAMAESALADETSSL